MYLDSIIGAKPLIGGLEPKIGDKYIKIVAIDGFPIESSPNILNNLNLMDFEYRFSNRFIYLDQNEALSLLDRERRKWNQQTTSLWEQLFNIQTNKIDKYAIEMVEQIDSAVADQKSNMVSFGYYSANIVILDENQERLHQKVNLTIQNIENLGFGARVENFNTIEAWLGTLPSHSIQNLRKQMISTLNLAHFIPTSNIWMGDRYNPSDKFPIKSPPLLHTVSDGQVPFRLNLHVGDVGHTLIFGPTGAGKSTLIALLVAQFHRYRDAKIFAFDKGNSLFALTKATGGKHYEILSEEKELFFSHRDETPAEFANEFSWLKGPTEEHTPPEQETYSEQELVSIHLKLDFIISLLMKREVDPIFNEKPRLVNISGAGMRFNVSETLRKGDVCVVKIFLPVLPVRVIRILAEVVRSEKIIEGGNERTEASFNFDMIAEEDREIIVHYTFKRQRELLREHSTKNDS